MNRIVHSNSLQIMIISLLLTHTITHFRSLAWIVSTTREYLSWNSFRWHFALYDFTLKCHQLVFCKLYICVCVYNSLAPSSSLRIINVAWFFLLVVTIASIFLWIDKKYQQKQHIKKPHIRTYMLRKCEWLEERKREKREGMHVNKAIGRLKSVGT